MTTTKSRAVTFMERTLAGFGRLACVLSWVLDPGGHTYAPAPPYRGAAMTPELLGSVAALTGVAPGHLRTLAGHAREMAVSAGVDLAEQGGCGRDFMVIVEGEADVLRDGRLVGRLRAGDCFGEFGAPTGAPNGATVTARTPMRLITFAGWDFAAPGAGPAPGDRRPVPPTSDGAHRVTVHIE
jgi:hypothetical protein